MLLNHLKLLRSEEIVIKMAPQSSIFSFRAKESQSVVKSSRRHPKTDKSFIDIMTNFKVEIANWFSISHWLDSKYISHLRHASLVTFNAFIDGQQKEIAATLKQIIEKISGVNSEQQSSIKINTYDRKKLKNRKGSFPIDLVYTLFELKYSPLLCQLNNSALLALNETIYQSIFDFSHVMRSQLKSVTTDSVLTIFRLQDFWRKSQTENRACVYCNSAFFQKWEKCFQKLDIYVGTFLCLLGRIYQDLNQYTSVKLKCNTLIIKYIENNVGRIYSFPTIATSSYIFLVGVVIVDTYSHAKVICIHNYTEEVTHKFRADFRIISIYKMSKNFN